MKISVIVPCYRQSQYLTGCIDVLLTQTHPDVEIIVVNDGSDDDTDAIAKSFGERIVYVSQANAGLAGARNTGIACATGHFLHFLDADDLLHPEALARLLAGSDVNTITVMGHRDFTQYPDQGIDHTPPESGLPFPTLLRRNFPVHCYLVPKHLVGQFDVQLRSHEDWDLWLRIALAGSKMRSIPFIGAYYRRQPGSMSGDTARMASTAADVILKFTTAAIERPDFLTRFGPELLRTLLALRRRNRLHRADVTNLLTAIDTLHMHGIRAQGAMRLADTMLGDVLERGYVRLRRR